MSETLIAALISAGVTLIVCIVNNHYQSSKIQALLEYRMDILERKQDKYNCVLERMANLETDTKVQAEQISNLADAIDDLKKQA